MIAGAGDQDVPVAAVAGVVGAIGFRFRLRRCCRLQSRQRDPELDLDVGVNLLDLAQPRLGFPVPGARPANGVTDRLVGWVAPGELSCEIAGLLERGERFAGSRSGEPPMKVQFVFRLAAVEPTATALDDNCCGAEQ